MHRVQHPEAIHLVIQYTLMSVTATVQDETTEIQGYISKMVHSNDLLSENFRLQKPNEEEEEPSWKDKHMDGMYQRQR